MALIPGTRYPAQTDADGDYPHGKARNAGSYNDGTGTPLEKDWVNDLWGFLQALLRAARITPSGDPDDAGASQYLEAVEHRAMIGGERVQLANWTTPADAVPSNAVTWSPALELFIAVGFSGGIATSPDGENWTSRTSGTSNQLTDVVASPAGVVVAVGQLGTITRSADGVTWAVQTSGVAGSVGDVVWHVDKFVALDTVGGHPITSPDGITWTDQSSSGVGPLATNGDELIMVSSSGTGWSSPDGITWTPRAITALDFFTALEWLASRGEYIVVGSGGYVATSPDGITWTEHATGTSVNLQGVCDTDNYIIAVGGSNTIIVSRDAVTWATIAHDLAAGGNTGVAWNGAVCVAVGGSSVAHRSMPRLPF
jgi:hypothetical protein